MNSSVKGTHQFLFSTISSERIFSLHLAADPRVINDCFNGWLWRAQSKAADLLKAIWLRKIKHTTLARAKSDSNSTTNPIDKHIFQRNSSKHRKCGKAGSACRLSHILELAIKIQCMGILIEMDADPAHGTTMEAPRFHSSSFVKSSLDVTKRAKKALKELKRKKKNKAKQ